METTGFAGFRRCKHNTKGPNAGRDYILDDEPSRQMFSSASTFTSGECWLGVQGKAEKRTGSNPATGATRLDSRRYLSSENTHEMKWRTERRSNWCAPSPLPLRWNAGECWSGVHCPWRVSKPAPGLTPGNSRRFLSPANTSPAANAGGTTLII